MATRTDPTPQIGGGASLTPPGVGRLPSHGDKNRPNAADRGWRLAHTPSVGRLPSYGDKESTNAGGGGAARVRDVAM